MLNVFDQYPEVENLIPFKVWTQFLDKWCTGKKIKKKNKITITEDQFKIRAESENIGTLLKELIECSDTICPDYFKKEDVLCLGGSGQKITIMRELVKVIDEMLLNNQLTKNDFSETTQNLIKKLKEFIDNNKGLHAMI
jgi:hypothetical protein